MLAPLPTIAYAKNAAHERFIKSFTGQMKARYNLAFLVGVEYIGGQALRAAIERDLGDPRYRPEDWCSTLDAVLIFDRAARAGISVERLGELVLPTYRRANPKVFDGKNVTDGFDILESAYRADTSYGGVSPGHEVKPGRVRLFRADSPLPCAYFVGVVRGLLQVFGVSGEVREVACQWEGEPVCGFEARWSAS